MSEIDFGKFKLGKWDFPAWEDFHKATYIMDFSNAEEYERTKAMIEFCTNYEPELFQTFYKWFRKEKERKEN